VTVQYWNTDLRLTVDRTELSSLTPHMMKSRRGNGPQAATMSADRYTDLESCSERECLGSAQGSAPLEETILATFIQHARSSYYLYSSGLQLGIGIGKGRSVVEVNELTACPRSRTVAGRQHAMHG
jgi:hypothetical protein